MRQRQREGENLITRINYNPRLIGLLSTLTFGTISLFAQAIEQGPNKKSLPEWAIGHIFDFFGGIVYPSVQQILLGDSVSLTTEGIAGFSGCAIVETMQAFDGGVEKLLNPNKSGTFDPWDYPAYALGTVTWFTYHSLAKSIYDSGITIPIYQALGIQDRRLHQTTI